MHGFIILGSYLIAGVCLYASLFHLGSGLHKPIDWTNLLFGLICMLTVPFSILNAWLLQVQDIALMTDILRWDIAIALTSLILLPWFIALYVQRFAWYWLWGLSAFYAILFIQNLRQPYTHIDRLQLFHLPWGETAVRMQGTPSFWVYPAAVFVVLIHVYVLTVVFRLYLRERRTIDLGMLLALGLFLVASIIGLLARLSLIHFVPLGPLGFLAMVIFMSLLLTERTRRRLQHSSRRFHALVEQAPFSIRILAPDGTTREVNSAWKQLWGKYFSSAERGLFDDACLLENGYKPYIERAFSGAVVEIPPMCFAMNGDATTTISSDQRWVRSYIYPIKQEQEEVSEVVLVHEDITDKKRVEDAIRLIAAGVASASGESFFGQMVQRLAELFASAYVFIALLDEDDPLRVNTLAMCHKNQLVENTGYVLTGTPCENVIRNGTSVYLDNVQHLFPQDVQLVRMGVVSYIGVPLLDVDLKPLGLLSVLDDKPLQHIEQLQEILHIFSARASAELQRIRGEAHIRRMAFEDYLTGLPSRARLHELLHHSLELARHDRKCGAVLLIDLDHFKTINDALGHDVGDEVLRALGHRLQDALGQHAVVARVGGDEFVALIDLADRDLVETERFAQMLAQQVMDKLQSPVLIGERAIIIGASIGGVVFPEDGETVLDILRHAEMALYLAKNQGRANTRFYYHDLQVAATNRMKLEEGLRHVVANKEIDLHFQPQVDADGRLLGAEALLRWHHPEQGDIAPSIFIPVAEETGLIHLLGKWVITRACQCLVDWERQGIVFSGRLSVNVSPWQFFGVDFVEQLCAILREYQISPDNLTLELTETALLSDLDTTIAKLNNLRALGFKISLDDFGTGYSSLAYLKHLPLDEMKIDKSFVQELDQATEHPLIESMIAIGRHMGLSVIAEGVETKAQRDILLQLGCRHFQGYLFSRPLPEDAFVQWLKEAPINSSMSRVAG